jgi:large subunit ribosomal protein L10
LAFTKQQKSVMLSGYENSISKSQLVLVLEYSKMRQQNIDDLRLKMRDAGAKLVIVKNTLMDLALSRAGFKKPAALAGNIIFIFGKGDVAGLAKKLTEAIQKSEVFKLKYGYLDGALLSAAQVKALADLPPLPVVRAQLLGTINGVASKLVRTLAEPGRRAAAVLQAHVDKQKEAAPEAA